MRGGTSRWWLVPVLLLALGPMLIAWAPGAGSPHQGPTAAPRSDPGHSGLGTLVRPALTLVETRSILITNTKAVATGSYNQRLDLNLNSLAPAITANATNFAFFYTNGTSIPAWIQFNASSTATDCVIWLRLVSIGASATLTINLDIYLTTDFVLNPKGAMGESPTNSSTYGKFDNGKQVFPFYDSFIGSTLNTGAWSLQGSGTTVVNNGITVTSSVSAPSNGLLGVVGTAKNVTGPLAMDIFGQTGTGGVVGIVLATTTTSGANQNDVKFFLSTASTGHWTITTQNPSGTFSTNTVTFAWSSTVNYLFDLVKTTHPQYEVNGSFNSGSVPGPGAFSTLSSTDDFPGIFIRDNTGTAGPVYYGLERLMPASGVMPTTGLIPNAPTGLNLVQTTETSFEAYWTNPAGTLSNDTVFWESGTSCTAFPHAISTGAAKTRAAVTALTTNMTYSVEVQAWNATGGGLLSSCVSVAVDNSVQTIPLTLTNSKPYATGTYEQSVFLNPSLITKLAANLSNFNIVYTNGTTVPTFIGGNVTNTSASSLLWLNITAGIAASSTLTLDLKIYPQSDFLWNKNGPIGVRPDFSASHYGAWDDGSQVFVAYWAFGSLSTLPGPWVLSWQSGGGTFRTTNYGIGEAANRGGIVAGNSGAAGADVIHPARATDFEADFTLTTNTSSAAYGYGWGYANATSTQFTGPGGGVTCQSSSNFACLAYQNGGTSGVMTAYTQGGAAQTNVFQIGQPSNHYPILYSIGYPNQGAGDQIYFQQNASHTINVTAAQNFSIYAQSGPSALMATGNGAANVYWIDYRTLPTFDQMPAASVALFPSAPTGLSVTSQTLTTVSLSWTNPSGTLTNDTIFWAVASTCSGSPTFNHAQSTSGAATSGTVTVGASTNDIFEVEAWNSAGASPPSSCVLANGFPAAPSGLSATISGTTLSASWTNPSGTLANDTLYYMVGSSCVSSGFSSAKSTAGAATSTTVTVTAGKNYLTIVQAWNATGAGVLSSCFLAAGVPQAPTGLTVTSIAAGVTVGLSWTNPKGTVVNDTVLFGSTCGTWTGHQSTSGAATTASVSSLPNGTTTCFAVEAWNATGVSAASSTVTDAPAAPTALGGFAQGATAVNLTWTNPAMAVFASRIDYGTTCSFGSSATGSGRPPQVVGGLHPSTLYCFGVAIQSYGGFSPDSVPLNVTTPFGPALTPPTNVRILGSTASSLTVAWTNPATKVTNDTVWWGLNCSATNSPASAGNSSQFVITGLLSFQIYCVRVQAWNGSQPSNVSNPGVYGQTAAAGGGGGGGGGCPSACPTGGSNASRGILGAAGSTPLWIIAGIGAVGIGGVILAGAKKKR